MRNNLTHYKLIRLIRDIYPGLKDEPLHADHNWNQRREGGGRYGPEEKARQQHALP